MKYVGGSTVSKLSTIFLVCLFAGCAKTIDISELSSPSIGAVAAKVVKLSIASGGQHTCALLDSGALQCWGANLDGALGDGSNLPSNVPVQVSGIDGTLSSAVDTSTGALHSCAVLDSGAIKCWGYNGDGELGDGTGGDSNVPVQVSGIDGIANSGISVASGTQHTCAVLSNGSVNCWGIDSQGALGNNGATGDSNIPVQVVGIDGVSASATKVSAGGFNSCALLNTGAVMCWGEGSGLGDGVNVDSSVPVQVSGIDGITSSANAIAVGMGSACAVLTTGSIKCWGGNGVGQLGDGTNGDANVPVQVSGINGILQSGVSVAVGQEQSCAQLSTGSAMCWGGNIDGELGDSSNSDSNVPVQVSGINGASKSAAGITAGTHFGCSVLSTGKVMCWGTNISGQLGDGTFNDSNVPVFVAFP